MVKWKNKAQAALQKTVPFFFIVCISHSILYIIAQKYSRMEGASPDAVLSFLDRHLSSHVTPLPPQHKYYLALLPIMISYFVVTGVINSFQPILEALDWEQPRTKTTVNVLNFLPESPTKHKPL